MKKTTFLSLFALLLIPLMLFSCSKSDEAPSSLIPKDGYSFASFSSKDLDGKEYDSAVFQEKKLTMINIWGTYCGPCIQEMPDLGKLNGAYGEDFQVIGIVLDTCDEKLSPVASQVEEARRLVEHTHADYLHLLPSASLVEICLADVQSIPATVFVNEEGKQVGQVYVGSRSEEAWSQIIETYLEQL